MDDEIDLGKIILDLWEGKWKIVISAVIAFIISLGLIFFSSSTKLSGNY
jgi:LPS O-antigen subunit length determinant protein (WzzB/FepE family)